MSRKPIFVAGGPQALCFDCAGVPVDVWLAAAEDGRAATAIGRRELARVHQLAEPGFAIHQHDHVAGHPGLRVSLSHTANLGAVASCIDPGVLGVGVDIEPAQRVLRPGAERHFLNSEDAPETVADRLSAWVAKEAAFKAADPVHQRGMAQTPLLLSRLWLRGSSFGLCGEEAPRGQYLLRDMPWGGLSVRIGVAVLRRPA